MKKFLFIALIALGMNANAQFTYEHTYDTASTMNTFYSADNNELMIVDFAVSGELYVRINSVSRTICTYDLNHTLLKTINCSSLPSNTNGTMGDILYLSQNLFSIDSKIAFMYIYTWGGIYKRGGTIIMNEDGVTLFSDTGAAQVNPTWAMQQWPIYNTTNGTKMILSYSNRQAKVFGLSGILTTAIQEANNTLIAAQRQGNISNPYPNPTNNSTKIDYELPQGINEGEIVFYNLQGMEVKRFKVDRTFNTLLISTSDLAAGTYLYQLQTSAQNSEGKKMVVIK